MKYTRFGKTEIMMPAFSCGGMRFIESWEDLAYSKVSSAVQDKLGKIARRAFELGINHFETARGYGTSEVQLAEALSELPREKIIIQTKIPPKEDPAEFEAALEKSFSNLKQEYLDLVAIHGAFNNDKCLEYSLRCWPVLDKYRKQGRIRHIGASGHGECDTVVKAINTGIFSYINLHFFYIQQEKYPAVRLAAEKDMGVFIISPNDKGGMLYKAPDKMRKLVAPFSPMQFNDLFCLSHPEVHTLSIGAACPEDFDEHIQILDQLDKADELAMSMAKKLDDAIDEVFGNAWLATYKENLPHYTKTFKMINIPAILWLYTLAKGLDMVEFAKSRYNLLGVESAWFSGGKAENFTDDDLAPFIKDSRHKDKIPQMLRDAHRILYDKELAEE